MPASTGRTASSRSLCTCGHRHRGEDGRCGVPYGPGNGKYRMVCTCPLQRATQPDRRPWNGLPSPARWDTRTLRVRGLGAKRARRMLEKQAHGVSQKRGRHPAAENAIERMQRRLRGEGY